MSITFRAVRKQYGGRVVVDNVTFTCPPGLITGFLGPNGAGKSTTLRILVGLTRADAGTAEIAGAKYRDISNPARVVGVLLDASALHPGRTGRETCRAVARLIGVDADRAEALLAEVGLTDAAGRRVRDYSMGMRQRLGLAVALMGDPTTLILDEPINGLDPEGVAWLRSLLRRFAAGGGTVLLSSHVLNEVQATVDRLVILHEGVVVGEGSLEELSPDNSWTTVSALNLDDLAAALRRDGISFEPASGHLRIWAPVEDIAAVVARNAIAVNDRRDGAVGFLGVASP